MVRLREVRDTADDALRRVAERSQALAALFDELAIDPAARTTSGVSVREEREYERNRWIHRGFAADARTVVRLTDLDVLGRLMTEATSRVDARIDGPWWRVLPSNPARLEASGRAAEDARSKARTYAEALGARLGPIAWIREPARDVDDAGPYLRATPMAAMADAGPDMPVDPGEMDVTAAVEVAFDLIQDPGR